MTDTVLVTGISGYIAGHVALGLLNKGYAVRGTVRALSKSGAVKEALKAAGADISNLSFAEVNLDSENGWGEAAQGCTYVQHIASPFPMEQPSDREALVPAARAGAQRVLAAGFAAGAKRIVMTSSMLAMSGNPHSDDHISIGENDWTDPDWRKLTAYAVSKTRAELSAWEYARVQGYEDRLTVVNPSFVLGPAVGKTYGTSLSLIEKMFAGEFSRTPKAAFPIVDVRDLAELHIAAMVTKNAAGRRLLGASNTLWLREIASICREAYPKRGRKLPKGELPNFVVRLAALFDDRIKAIVADLGSFHEADNEYVTQITGVKFRPAKESIIASCEYLIAQGKI